MNGVIPNCAKPATIRQDDPDSDRWNYNTHYYRLTDPRTLGTPQSVLDVGCGEGMLTRRLLGHVPHVVGIDPDRSSIDAARARSDAAEYICGDVFEHPFAPGSFDAVVSVAALHHMDAQAGLRRLAELVRPGGTLVVVSCARSTFPRDAVVEVVSLIAGFVQLKRHALWMQPSPVVWPPPLTYRSMRAIADEVLPGSTFRRRLLFRYSIIWHKPETSLKLVEYPSRESDKAGFRRWIAARVSFAKVRA